MFKSKLVGFGLLASIANVATAAVSIVNAGSKCGADIRYFDYEGMSGVTWVSNNTFYVVQDRCKILTMRPALDANGNLNANPAMSASVDLVGAHDTEGIARDPSTGNVWVSDEQGATILEYDPVTGYPTYRAVPVPSVITGRVRGNLSLESLTISGDGLAMWTANEEALSGDGDTAKTLAGSGVGTIVRLVKFTREDVAAPWQPAGMWAYQCEPLANDEPQNGGVSDLAALPDGSLLVMERHVEATNWGIVRIFRVTPGAFAAATDVSSITQLSGASYTPVSKGGALYTQIDGGDAITGGFMDYDVACYEGLCLGPRNSDGSINLMMVSDGGAVKSVDAFFWTTDVTTQPYVRALKLTGMDIVTVSYDVPDGVTANPFGGNYRHLRGDEVTATLTVGSAAPGAYTNNGATVVSASWSAGSASGPGEVAQVTLTADATTIGWRLTSSIASTAIGSNDSFEGFEAGTMADAIEGWAGDGMVEEFAYTPPTPPGYSMPAETHTRVLNIQEPSVRALPSNISGNRHVDLMVEVRPSLGPIDEPSGTEKMEVVVDETGHFQIWHLKKDGNSWVPGWTRLSDTVYSKGQWIRLEFDLEESGGLSVCRVKINGSVCPTAEGFRTPACDVPVGPWHRLADGAVAAMTQLEFAGSRLDDVLITTDRFVAEHTGPTSTNGVDFAWFDEAGLPRDPDAPAPRLAGRTVKYIHDSGVEPYSERELEITRIDVGDDGKVHLDFNGYKGDAPERAYRVLRSTNLSTWTPLNSAAGEFEGDSATWSSSWEGEDSGASVFYRIEAVPTIP